MKQKKRQWKTYWQMYKMGLVTLQDIKNLMKEKYTSGRDSIVASESHQSQNSAPRQRVNLNHDKSTV